VPGPKVFVSYSHRDGKALDQLQRFLRPLEREGLLAAWADTALHGGDDWKREIDQALAEATVAVLLISQDFLDSSFIVKEEMPRILEREAAGRMTVLPVFLSPSLAGDVGFPDPRTGGRTKILLTKFQGCGTPAKPLSGVGWSERERAYADLARRLLALTGTMPAMNGGPILQAPSAVPAAASSPGPARAFELTVQLEERGDSFWVTYHLPGREPIGSSARPAAEALRRIDPIHETLDTANNRSLLQRLGSSPAAWGEVLFGLLFGPVEQWEPVFRPLFGRPAGTRPNPSLFPVRLRIHADDPRLTGLPWRLTSWKGQPLLDAEWTFTTTQTADPAEDHLTTAPSNVLVVAPQTAGDGGGPHDPEHARAVSDVLAKAWPTGRDPGYVQTVRTRAAARTGSAQPAAPHPLSVWPRCRGRRASELSAGGGARGRSVGPRGSTPAVHLHRACSGGRLPQHGGLNDGGKGGALPTPDQILGGVPLLLWRRRPEWSADSTTTALLWLHRWLAQGEDPVAAFHQIQRDAIPPSCEAATLAICSNYRGWRTATYQAAPQRHYPSLRLDRDHQKSLVRKHLEELVRSGAKADFVSGTALAGLRGGRAIRGPPGRDRQGAAGLSERPPERPRPAHVLRAGIRSHREPREGGAAGRGDHQQQRAASARAVPAPLHLPSHRIHRGASAPGRRGAPGRFPQSFRRGVRGGGPALPGAARA
jgi:TIR domain